MRLVRSRGSPSPPLGQPGPPPRQWIEAAPGNVDGVASALTVLGPMRRLWLLKVFFWLRRHVSTVREHAAGNLRALSFLHSARWVLIDGLPGADGTTREPLRSVHLYFEANFNGTFEQYIDAFSYVIPGPIEDLFGGAYGFPGPQPATMFKSYIRRHEYPAALYYSAYPKHTATQILAALAQRARIASLADAAPDLKPEAFAKKWHDLLAERPAMVPIKVPRQEDPNYAIGGQAYALTVFTAIRPGREYVLRRYLKRLKEAGERPFEQSATTHLARLVVVDWLADEGSPHGAPILPYQYLLFATMLDGDPDHHLLDLCHRMPRTVDAIWGNCLGALQPPSASPAAFAKWMRANQFDTSAFFAPYSTATVAEVRAALDVADRARHLALKIQYGTPQALHTEFLREFGGGRMEWPAP
jgi:hypothetical protein